MVEHVYRRAARARGLDAVLVATDDLRVAAAVESFGGLVRMTRDTHRSGTDRVAEVAADLSCDVIVNVQGDEPAIEPATIEAVLAVLADNPSALIATARCRLAGGDEYVDPAVVKVVVDAAGRALYFSRAPIPFDRSATPPGRRPPAPAYRHVGLYAYRRETLLTLAALPPTALEAAESLEQLRALEHGIPIHTVETFAPSIGVDTPEDLERARRELSAARA